MPPNQLSLPEATPRDPSSKAITTEPQFSTSPQPVSTLAAAPRSLATREQSATSALTETGRIAPLPSRSPSLRLMCSMAPMGWAPRRNKAPPPACLQLRA